ncbi:MAG: hemolysin III family protein, partial [Bacillota bacterium]|nr:hemolysin III family protein [Bacillota bacterium]
MSESKLYTLGEEIMNSVTHGIGALLSVAATVIMIVCATKYNTPLAVVSSAVFGATLIILYTSSTLYHAFTNVKVKSLFQIFDHCTIFLLIAGTYTPLTLVAIGGKLGWTVFAVIWAAAVLGIILNAISLKRFAKISMVLYLAMGWAAIVTFGRLIEALGTGGIVFLVAGGVAYTVGVIFYALNKRCKFMHSIWHLFVLAGS